jgi:peptidoglycan/xylan/chitin deacetylase (PgdA/CDA1 family)
VAPGKNYNWVRSHLTLELKYFEDLLNFIKKRKLKTFFISEMDNPIFQYDNSIGLAFDDGYLDNYVYVFPLLKKYNVKATIFVSPDYIDPSNELRPSLIDVWKNRIKEDKLNPWGFLSVEEMKTMLDSGLIDIQSHTLTHDKYPVSENIVGFNHINNVDINSYLAENPKIKPYYINDTGLKYKIPHGTPVFEEKSAVVSPRVWINEDFKEEISKKLNNFDFNRNTLDEAFEKVNHIIEEYRKDDAIIKSREKYNDYIIRVKHEVLHSKQKLEKLLDKNIEVICWPHGDFNKDSIDFAREAGYKKIHFVETKSQGVNPAPDLFTRMGMNSYKNNRFLTMLKTKARIYNHIDKFPYPQIASVFKRLKMMS